MKPEIWLPILEAAVVVIRILTKDKDSDDEY